MNKRPLSKELPPVITERQGLLFDPVGVNPASARNWVGEYFEEATYKVSGGRRYKTSGRHEHCPDIGWGRYSFFEIKGVGKSNQSIIYEGRLAKDRAWLDRTGNSLYYWFWRHSFAVTKVDCRADLYEGLARNLKHTLLVSFETVEAWCKAREPKLLNSGYSRNGTPMGYGEAAKGYGTGWAVKMTDMLALCDSRLIVPVTHVYDTVAIDIDVRLEYPHYHYFIQKEHPVAEQKKLAEPVNIFPDGDDSTKIVGFGFPPYDNGGATAVIMIFADGHGDPLSVNLQPNDMAALGQGEFYVKNWSEMEHIVKRLEELDIVRVLDKPPVASGHVQVSTAILNEAKLTAFTPQELEKFHA